MNITLVYPPYGYGKRSRYFPFGLAYIAALLEKEHAVTIVDMEGEDLDLDSALARIIKAEPALVGFGGMITRFRMVRDLAQRLRSELPGVFLIAGNSGATTIPELYISSCDLDAVVMGEGEVTSVELARAVESGRNWHDVPGIAFRDDNGKLVYSKTRELISDLDSLPWPAWDIFPIETYISSIDHRQKRTRHLEVVASRGCPFNCVYCYRIYGRTVRRRSPASIVDEICELVRRYDIHYTGFPDDLFTSNREFVLETCRLLLKRVPDIRWSCLGRVNTVDEQLLSEMKRAGCDWISYGIETGSNELLSAMKRGVTSEECLKAIRLTRNAGIHAEGSFMIGMFGETKSTVGETIDFCRQADITAPMLFVTPYPGTEIFDIALERGMIEDVEGFVESMNAADQLLVNLTDMSDSELIGLRNWAQGTIGRNYLWRKPLTRFPNLFLRHFSLKGARALYTDLKELVASFRRRRGA